MKSATLHFFFKKKHLQQVDGGLVQVDTVDGRNPAPPLGCKNPVNNGINYQPQLVSRIYSITRLTFKYF